MGKTFFFKIVHKLKIPIAIAILAGLFLYYNLFGVDRTLENLKFSLQQATLARNIEDINGVDMVLDRLIAREIFSLEVDTVYLANLEYAKNIVNTGREAGHLNCMKTALISAINYREKNRKFIFITLDALRRKVSEGKNNSILKPRPARTGPAGEAQDLTLLETIRSIEKESDLQSAALKYGKLIKENDEANKISLLTLRSAHIYHRLGKNDKALGLYREIIKTYPSGKEAKIAKILIDSLKQEKKLLNKANSLIIKYSETIDVKTKQNIAYEIGAIYTKLFNLEEAKKFFKRAIQPAPSSDFGLKARFNLAWILKEEHRLEESMEYFSQIVEEKPESLLALNSRYQLADVLYREGNYEEAINVWCSVAEEHKDKGGMADLCLLQAGATYMYDLGDNEKAVKVFEKLKEEKIDKPSSSAINIEIKRKIPLIATLGGVYFVLTVLWPFACLLSTMLAVMLPPALSITTGASVRIFPMFYVNIIFFIGIIAAMLHVVLRRKWSGLKGKDIFSKLVPFLFVIVISTLYNAKGADPNLFPSAILAYLMLGIFLAYTLAANAIRSEKAFRVIMYIYPLAGFALCVYLLKGPLFHLIVKMAISQLLKTNINISGEVVGRLTYRGVSPNVFAAYLNTLLPVTIALFFVERKKTIKITIAIISALMLCTIMLTLTRGAIIAFILGMTVWAAMLKAKIKVPFLELIKRKKRDALILLVISGAVIFFLMKSFSSQNFETARLTTNFLTDNLQGRFALFQQALKTAFQNPIVGVGPGNFSVSAMWDYSSPPVWQDAHNVFFQIFADTGILGLLAYLYFLKTLISNTARNLGTEEPFRASYVLRTGLAVTFFVFLIHSLVDAHFIRYGVAIQIGINLGLLHAAAAGKYGECAEPPAEDRTKKPN